MTKILQDFQKYQDEFGLNQIKTKHNEETGEDVGETSQNGTLCTAEYILCFLNSEAPNEEKLAEIERIKKVFFLCQKDAGYSVRYPGSEEFDSMDNNVALLIFSAAFDDGNFAKEMRVAGHTVKCVGYDQMQDTERNKKFYWLYKLLGLPYWNNQDPHLFCFVGWYGRSPGFMAILDLCSNGETSLFRWVALLIGQFIGATAPAGDTSGRKLQYLVWQFIKGKNFITRALYKLWCWQLTRVYPNSGIKGVYSIWYQDAQHPIVTYSEDYIE